MHNLIVMGCYRSGTSMVAGTLATAGYLTHVDNKAWAADEHNETGYYEDAGVIQINEAILSKETPSVIEALGHKHLDASMFPFTLGWLCPLKPGTPLSMDEHLLPLVRHTLKKEPYCLKDPRFCHTLGAWRPFLQNTRFICVFRQPILTIQSLVRYSWAFDHLKPLKIDESYAQTIWLLMYQHILDHHAQSGEWLFIHYDQMFDDVKLDELDHFAGARVARTFPQQRFRRVAPEAIYSRQVSEVYEELCKQSKFKS